MDHVFISHSSHDRAVADQLCAFLESRDIPCWIAPRDISSGNYAGEITRALKAADTVIIICSRKSCRSEHVKNEVSLAFNHAKLLLPYCLEEDPFDDDLEYYLSSKQRIIASSNKEYDFQLIEGVIREFRGQQIPPAHPVFRRKSLKWGWIPASLVLLAGLYFFLHPSVDALEPEKPDNSEDSLVQAPLLPAEPVPVSTPAHTKRPDGNIFSGNISNGYPDGYGTYTFRKARLIDAHDPESRMAEPGDYIEGNWTQGHLNYGNWYSQDGLKKGFLQLGDHPDVDKDQTLGPCGRP